MGWCGNAESRPLWLYSLCVTLTATPTDLVDLEHGRFLTFSLSLFPQVKKMARKQNIESNNNNSNSSNNNSSGNGGGGGGESKKTGQKAGQKRKSKEEDSDSSDCAMNPSSNDSGLPSKSRGFTAINIPDVIVEIKTLFVREYCVDNNFSLRVVCVLKKNIKTKHQAGECTNDIASGDLFAHFLPLSSSHGVSFISPNRMTHPPPKHTHLSAPIPFTHPLFYMFQCIYIYIEQKPSLNENDRKDENTLSFCAFRLHVHHPGSGRVSVPGHPDGTGGQRGGTRPHVAGGSERPPQPGLHGSDHQPHRQTLFHAHFLLQRRVTWSPAADVVKYSGHLVKCRAQDWCTQCCWIVQRYFGETVFIKFFHKSSMTFRWK